MKCVNIILPALVACTTMLTGSIAIVFGNTGIATVTGHPMIFPVLAVLSSMITTSSGQGVDCDVGYTSYKGKTITSINAYVEGSVPALNVKDSYECCQACIAEPGCAYSIFGPDGGCGLALIGGGCQDNAVAGEFFTDKDAGGVGIINNGPCGYLVYGGDHHGKDHHA